MTDHRTTTSAIDTVEAMGVHCVTPHLVCAGAAEAIAFYKEAFGASEMARIPGPDGKLIHASVMINGSSVMLVDEYPEMGALAPTTLKGTPVTIHLTVEDVDAFAAKAVAAGARVIMPVADQFWGDRYGVIADPFGHHWSIATPGKEQPSMEEIQRRMAGMSAECGPGSGAQPN